MAHSLRAVALASGLTLAAFAVRCEPQTFDLLPEYGAGTSGKEPTGGRGNSNNGGMSFAGSGGRGSDGKQSGGQFNAGGLSIGGFGSLTGGRPNQALGGSAGKSGDSPPAGCGQYCGPSGCLLCAGVGENGGCPPSFVCPLAGSPFALRCPVCVACVSSLDCATPLPICSEKTKTCTQECASDSDCSGFPQRLHCDNNLCVECRDQNHHQCSEPRPLCHKRDACVECLNESDCSPQRPICDRERGVCL